MARSSCNSNSSLSESTLSRSVTDGVIASSVSNVESFSQVEEEFSSFNSSIDISTNSSFYLDSSSLSSTLNQTIKDLQINGHPSPREEHLSGIQSLLNDLVEDQKLSSHFDNEESSTFHLIANLRNQFNENRVDDIRSNKIRSNSPSNGSISSDSTCDSLPNGSYPPQTDDSVKPRRDKPKVNKDFLIAQELMTSEQVYVDALKLILQEFKSFLENYNKSHNVSAIPLHEFDKIFNTLPQLLHLNEDLLTDLKVRIDEWHERPRIADVIVRKGPFLKLYTTYMKDFESQCNYIDECCQKYPKFSKVLREFETSPTCKNLTLRHYMLKPVQRIPHYRLLLEDYLNHLSKDSEEYHDTEVALNIIKDVLHHANSSLKLAVSILILLSAQNSNIDLCWLQDSPHNGS